MAVATFKRIDKNRFIKAYPYLQREPVFANIGSSVFSVEHGTVSFGGQSSVTYYFTGSFASAPTVVASPNLDDVSVFVSAVSSTSVTFQSSAATTGSVSFEAVSL